MKLFSMTTRSCVVPLIAALASAPLSTLANTDCNDPIITTSESLIQRALSCNASQQAIDARWQAQKFSRQSVGRLDDPKLSLSVAPQTFGDDQIDDGVVVEFSQPLPWPGVLSLREQAANAQSDVWLSRLTQEQVLLANAVRQRLAQWQTHRSLLAINQQHLQLWEEFIAVVRAKYASGTAGKSAVLQATHEHHLLLQEAIELKAVLVRDVSEIKRLGNLPGETVLQLDASLPITSLPLGALDFVLGDLGQQPAVAGLQAQQRQKASELALAKKDRYPNFSAMARYNSMWMNEEHRWMVGVSVNLPLDFGKRSSRESSLQAEQSALQWEQQDLHVQLRAQLIQTHSRWQQAIDVYQLYQKELLPLAQENLTTTLEEYQSGAGDFLSLLTAERQLLTTQRKAEDALGDQYAQFALLTAAAGFVDLKSWNSLAAYTHNTTRNGESRHE